MPRALPGHCGAEIEGRDHTKGGKRFHTFHGGKEEGFQLYPQPDTHKHTVAVNCQPLLGCWSDPLQESQAPLPPDMPRLLACHAVQSGQFHHVSLLALSAQ